MKTLHYLQKLTTLVVFGLILVGCSDDDEGTGNPTLEVPTEYISTNYSANVAAENTVVSELANLTSAANTAERNANDMVPTDASIFTYDNSLVLWNVTEPNYRSLVEGWIDELVKSANAPYVFVNPGLNGTPATGDEGGILGDRLFDENALELEQMIQKGQFGAALYNHAITVVNAIKTGAEGFTSSAAIDRLVEIHGTGPAFDVSNTTAAATYSRRRSNLTAETGFFFDIKQNLLTAKAAMEAGSDFNEERDAALDEYLLNWEKSNFATVIYYVNATITQLQNATNDKQLGDAMHAYAEGVAFAHGFKRLSTKVISDAEIDEILEAFLAPEGKIPASHRFLNEAALLNTLPPVIDKLQDIYGFTDAEVISFYVNNNP
jgi:uncharacterized protein YcfL